MKENFASRTILQAEVQLLWVLEGIPHLHNERMLESLQHISLRDSVGNLFLLHQIGLVEHLNGYYFACFFVDCFNSYFIV